MNKKDISKSMRLTPIEDLITEDFGEIGTPARDQFEMDCDAFVIGERLKEERIKAGLTQEQLADRIGTKKSFISRVERGHADIQLSTLVKLFQGLGRQISVRVFKIRNDQNLQHILPEKVRDSEVAEIGDRN